MPYVEAPPNFDNLVRAARSAATARMGNAIITWLAENTALLCRMSTPDALTLVVNKVAELAREQ